MKVDKQEMEGSARVNKKIGNNININFDNVDRPRRGGGIGKVDRVLCKIGTLFDAFLAFLDTHQVVFSPYLAIAKIFYTDPA